MPRALRGALLLFFQWRTSRVDRMIQQVESDLAAILSAATAE